MQTHDSCFCKYTNVHIASFSKCNAQLEVLLRGPPEWCVQKFFRGGGHPVITIEVSDVKNLGPKD